MEGPLYGETTKGEKALFYIVTIGFGLLTVAAVLACVIVAFMDKNFSHMILVIALAIITITVVLMFRWYRAEHIHPKFKWIIALLIACLGCADVAGLVYSIAYKIPTPEPLPNCSNGLYNFNTSKCISVPNGNLKHCIPPNCMFFSGAKGCCGNCTQGFEKCMNGSQDVFDLEVTDMPITRAQRAGLHRSNMRKLYKQKLAALKKF